MVEAADVLKEGQHRQGQRQMTGLVPTQETARAIQMVEPVPDPMLDEPMQLGFSGVVAPELLGGGAECGHLVEVIATDTDGLSRVIDRKLVPGML